MLGQRRDPGLHGLLVISVARALEGVAPDRHVRSAVALHGIPAVDDPVDLVRGEGPAHPLDDEREVRRTHPQAVRQRAVSLGVLAVARRAIGLVEVAAHVAALGSPRGGGEQEARPDQTGGADSSGRHLLFSLAAGGTRRRSGRRSCAASRATVLPGSKPHAPGTGARSSAVAARPRRLQAARAARFAHVRGSGRTFCGPARGPERVIPRARMGNESMDDASILDFLARKWSLLRAGLITWKRAGRRFGTRAASSLACRSVETVASRILVVEDEPAVRTAIGRFFSQQGFDVDVAGDVFDAEACLSRSSPDVLILDHDLPGPTGTARIGELRALAPDAAIVLMTSHDSIEMAVEATRAGAEHFLVKPVELPALERIVERVVQSARYRRRSLARSAHGRDVPNPLVGSSPAIRALAMEVAHLERSDRPVLITGETGSGKGMLAGWLHHRSTRADESLVEVRCAGLSRERLESELFGHEEGAFIGAGAARPGLLEAAHRGTLFLDDIGDLDFALQPKLLAALEERRCRRLGGVRDHHSD